VNYPTLTDGASCESSQPFLKPGRETFVLRSAVCRRSSSFENGPSTWHFAIGCIAHPLVARYGVRQILLYFYLRGYPRWLETARTPIPQGLLFCTPIESLVSLRSSRFSSVLLCVINYIKLVDFIPRCRKGTFRHTI